MSLTKQNINTQKNKNIPSARKKSKFNYFIILFVIYFFILCFLMHFFCSFVHIMYL